MRRKSDGWLNATQILKVAGFDKPQRTRVLEREVQKGTHEKVQGGYGKYQGESALQSFEGDGQQDWPPRARKPRQSFTGGWMQLGTEVHGRSGAWRMCLCSWASLFDRGAAPKSMRVRAQPRRVA